MRQPCPHSCELLRATASASSSAAFLAPASSARRVVISDAIERSFRALQGCGGRVRIGFEWRGVDLEQWLTGTYLGSLFKQALLHDTADLRTNLGNTHC